MMQKLDKNVDKKLKMFYKEFFYAHDNNGIEIVIMGFMVFLQLIILWTPEPIHWIEQYGITWSYAENICIYSFVFLWRYSQTYRFYSMEGHKRISMFEILQYTPVSKLELKKFWMKQTGLMGLKVSGLLLIYHLIRAMMEWNQINAWNILMPLVFSFVIPIFIVNSIILVKK